MKQMLETLVDIMPAIQLEAAHQRNENAGNRAEQQEFAQQRQSDVDFRRRHAAHVLIVQRRPTLTEHARAAKRETGCKLRARAFAPYAGCQKMREAGSRHGARVPRRSPTAVWSGALAACAPRRPGGRFWRFAISSPQLPQRPVHIHPRAQKMQFSFARRLGDRDLIWDHQLKPGLGPHLVQRHAGM